MHLMGSVIPDSIDILSIILTGHSAWGTDILRYYGGVIMSFVAEQIHNIIKITPSASWSNYYILALARLLSC